MNDSSTSIVVLSDAAAQNADPNDTDNTTTNIDSFRVLLEKAIRQSDATDDGSSGVASIDWSPHTVDYGGFKERLKFYAQRRAQLRTLLRESKDSKLSERVVLNLLGVKQPFPSKRPPQQQHAMMMPAPPPPPTPLELQLQQGRFPRHRSLQPLPSEATMRGVSGVGATDVGCHELIVPTSPCGLELNPFERTMSMDRATSSRQQSPTTAAAAAGMMGYYSPTSHYVPFIDDVDDYGDLNGSQSTDGEGSGVVAAAATAANAATATQQQPSSTSRSSFFSAWRPRRKNHRSIMRHVSNVERNDMIQWLSYEMDNKVLMFYLSQWQKLSSRLEQAQQQQQQRQQALSRSSSWRAAATNTTTTSAADLTAIGDEILELAAYCVMNIITVRQILIRYDSFARSCEGTPMLTYYLKHVMKNSATSFRKILHHEELHAIADSYQDYLVNMIQQQRRRGQRGTDIDDYLTYFVSSIDMLDSLLLSSQSAQEASAVVGQHQHQHQHQTSGRNLSQKMTDTVAVAMDTTQQQQQQEIDITTVNSNARRVIHTVRDWFLVGAYNDGRLYGLEPANLTMRGMSLTTEMHRIVDWRTRQKQQQQKNKKSKQKQQSSTAAAGVAETSKQSRAGTNKTTSSLICCGAAGTSTVDDSTTTTTTTTKTTDQQQQKITEDGDVTDDKAKDKPLELTHMQVFHLTLNLISAMLYCMNYYIVEPSSTMYVNRLGAHDAMSGTLIGMMPLAAFLSSIPFSMWTNTSFRHPLILSCLLLVIGNITYSVADLLSSCSLALLGRFIAGLGAPKIIIRRYMADTTPLSLRTSVNAGFGMVVAVGSAMGPAMAILLNKIEYSVSPFKIPWFNERQKTILLQFNGLTLPGYFMACLWLTFTVVVLLTFDEPHRHGLEEQKRLERERHGGGGDAMIAGSPSTMSLLSSHGDEQSATQPSSTQRATGIFRGGQQQAAPDNELLTAFSGDSYNSPAQQAAVEPRYFYYDDVSRNSSNNGYAPHHRRRRRYIPVWMVRIQSFLELITLPVRLCLGMLFAKVFVIESLVSCTSALTKNRYHWQVTKVGMLGCINGLLVIPFSIMIGRLSLRHQDHVLMKWLVSIGCCGFGLLIDLSDLVATPTGDYNKNHILAVSPPRYVLGYFMSYLSIQAFEGVIGSCLSKVIPTSLASGTFNSGLLATLVDTLGRTCGDLFISTVGFISLRQLMNLLFIPGFTILLTCLIIIERYRDMLSV